MKKIYVIGAGINGMSAAVQLAEHFQNKNVQVTVMADKLTPFTLSDLVAGLWSPYLMGNTDPDKIIQWSKGTHKFFHELWINGLAGESGVTMSPVIGLSVEDPRSCPSWKDIPFGFRELTADEVEKYSNEHGRNYLSGYQFVSFCCQPKKMLPYLTKRFLKAGGKFEQRKIVNLEDVTEADLIINCTGLGGKFLGDDQLHPIRGQVTRVKAPWMNGVIIDNSDDGNYIIPNDDSVVLGGTHQVDDYNLNVSLPDHDFINAGCQRMVKSLVNAEMVINGVGLRPGRNSVRLETEYRGSGKTPIIHNVGHGGSGVTLSWGCGTEVLERAIDVMNTTAKL
ncbi:D-amino-acid oxidase [Chironomus tepperi]|uniref:D-amino-acid oxidase n=1 Tax=Chironomus tepperi TaxID=113505 RepID=UPI00391FABF2